MAGNLTEWVYDSFYEYSSNDKSDPVNVNSDKDKMQKGGFWAGSAGRVGVNPDEVDEGHNIRSDARQSDDKSSADDHLGFRVAITYAPR